MKGNNETIIQTCNVLWILALESCAFIKRLGNCIFRERPWSAVDYFKSVKFAGCRFEPLVLFDDDIHNTLIVDLA